MNSISCRTYGINRRLRRGVDNAKSYIASGISEITGSGAGHYDDMSSFQESVFVQFSPTVKQTKARWRWSKRNEAEYKDYSSHAKHS